MKAKAKDFAAALRWAERGLEIYGSEGLREEMVADLRERVSEYRAKAERALNPLGVEKRLCAHQRPLEGPRTRASCAPACWVLPPQ